MTEPCAIASVFALDTLALSDEGVWCPLRHPVTGAPLVTAGGPVRLRLLGVDGRRFQAVRLGLAARRRQGLLAGEPAEALEAGLELELAVQVTLGWENVLTPDGRPLAFGPEAARKLYGDCRWVLEQAAAFVGDRANFLKASGRS